MPALALFTLLCFALINPVGAEIGSQITEDTPNSCQNMIRRTLIDTECEEVAFVEEVKKFCMDILNGFRCTERKVRFKEVCEDVEKQVNEVVWECCNGFYESGPKNCSPCKEGSFGHNCSQNCFCENSARCNPVDGSCHCPSGFQGRSCNQPCPTWKYGKDCSLDCACDRNNTHTCGTTDGKCECKQNFTDAICSTFCPEGLARQECVSTACPCKNGGVCSQNDSTCICEAGWTGTLCTEACQLDFWGVNCQSKCSSCGNGTCNRFTGSCDCHPGYTGEKCDLRCSSGLWGQNCIEKCQCANSSSCSHVNGVCDNFSCPPGRFGMDCGSTCYCENNATCDPITGECICSQPGFTGRFCHKACPQGTYGESCSKKCNCMDGDQFYCDNVFGCAAKAKARTATDNSPAILVAMTFVSFLILLAVLGLLYFYQSRRYKPTPHPLRIPPVLAPSEGNGYTNPQLVSPLCDTIIAKKEKETTPVAAKPPAELQNMYLNHSLSGHESESSATSTRSNSEQHIYEDIQDDDYQIHNLCHLLDQVPTAPVCAPRQKRCQSVSLSLGSIDEGYTSQHNSAPTANQGSNMVLEFSLEGIYADPGHEERSKVESDLSSEKLSKASDAGGSSQSFNYENSVYGQSEFDAGKDNYAASEEILSATPKWTIGSQAPKRKPRSFSEK